ncbi:MAG TPA: PEP/pyruvate-binding domain-containing protein [Bacteroidales bacterium]|nr:PEP/pyruvate-binding domain-containing protein [Bacteroidales bacterium]HPT02917.1 PEP/pyruvate-binding domain-containing protein [Bacteroidales bacterium]
MDEDNISKPSRNEIDKLISERTERLKELAAINRTTEILKEGKPPDETLQQLAMIFPAAWQYPDFTVCRITYGGKEYKSPNFTITKWLQRQSFDTIEGRSGYIDIFYLKEFMQYDEGPFLKEERHLIANLATAIAGYLNSITAREILRTSGHTGQLETMTDQAREQPLTGRQLLHRFLNKNNYNRDIYHDLQPFKVREILLVANLYDAYSIEREGRFSEYVLGEYHQLSLSSAPRITGVSTAEEAFEQLNSRHYDLVIFMVGVDKSVAVSLPQEIRKQFPYIPIFTLLNNNTDVEFFTDVRRRYKAIDQIFVWNGESKVFFAMIKMLEDKINVDNDTRVGMVRVILLVEDSPQYYSRYLPLLYGIVMDQTKRIIDDVSSDELYKVLRLRARPKILLASSHEEALKIINDLKDYMLCLITDVKFERGGKLDPEAGFNLVSYVREVIHDLPVIIQSSEVSNAERAYELRATFIDKYSESLSQEFKSFIAHYLGFGNFIYRNSEGQQIAVAKSLKEFENLLRTIPDESLIYHARKDHFSMWLMARGEIQVAKIINPQKVTDFESPAKLRQYLIEVIQQFRNEQNKGKIIPFEESAILDEHNVVSLMPGSLGGKGRGLAFINTLIYNYDFNQHVPNINIRSPKTSVIGTDEFEYFIERNKLLDKVLGADDYEEVRRLFISGNLTDTLIRRLRVLLKLIDKPLAVRSSGTFEDSLAQPFAGIFETYLLPNNHPDINVRLRQLMDAIKLVYASVFSPEARGYIEAINYKLEDEKMAVVIQEVVGNQFEDVFYPHISGVAQSYNYYPFGHLTPEDGFAVMALGLGKYVVEGGSAYRFSPAYPAVENYSPKDLYKNSQMKFLAVDLVKGDIDLLEGEMAGLREIDIDEAERHGTLSHLASVYDPESNRMAPGLTHAGPRIINFSDILKYDYAPLAKTIETVLDIVKEALGTPVEIEFAVDLNRDGEYKTTFYLLQIKPLIGAEQDYQIDLNEIPEDEIILLSFKGMGNGVINDIQDVIYIDPERFDKSRTVEMAKEIEILNHKMRAEKRRYVLIGPGRWGTRDRWIGIPVNWPQISNAKVIVETSLEGYPLDASSGSHFFHNVTSMNVGYFTVQPEVDHSFVRYTFLRRQELIEKTAFFNHVRLQKPLNVKMDGRKRLAVITRNGKL